MDFSPIHNTPITSRKNAQRVLFGGIFLSFVANIAVFGHSPGLGWALFACSLWGALLFDRRQRLFADKKRIIIFGVCALATLIQTIVRPSGSNLITLAMITTVLAAAPYGLNWRALPEALVDGLLSPFRFPYRIGKIASTRVPGQHVIIEEEQARRITAVLIPTALTFVIFAVLMINGNGMLKLFFSHALADTRDAFYQFEYPGPGRIFFVVIVAMASIGLLWNHPQLPQIGSIKKALAKSWPEPTDLWIASWRTRATLLAANTIFLIANSTDALYLWAKTELPAELTLAQFVHQGTGNLIASTVIAGITLVAIFRQDKEVTGQRWTVALAFIWIFQNLLLVSSVILRIITYIDGYGLSLLRLHLILSMLVIAAGFIILALAIGTRATTGRIARNLMVAMSIAIFALQFWDARAFVARTNFTLAKEWKETHVNHLYIDADYIASLGQSSYPTLIKIASGAEGFAKHEIQNSQRALDKLRQREQRARFDEGWEDYSLHRRRMRGLLLD